MRIGMQRDALSIAFSLAAVLSPASAATFRVAVDGNDQWSGTRAAATADGADGPFATAARAQEAVRAAIRAGSGEPIEVVIGPGVHYLTEPLVFGTQDSGRESAPVTYRGEGRAVLSGGRPIGGWRETTLDGKRAWKVDLPEVKSGAWTFHQLFVDGRRRERPRLPKEGTYRFTGSPQFKKGAPYNQGWNQVSFEPGHIRNWRNIGDVEVVVLHFWVSPRLQVAEVDEAANLVTFTRKTHRRMTNSFDEKKFARYYVENVREALSEPGQWYLDRKEGTLWYLPMDGEDPARTSVVAPRLEQLLRIIGEPGDGKPVEHLAFRNLQFEHAEWYKPEANAADGQASMAVPGAVSLTHARDCAFSGCGVAHVSNYGIEIGAGCRNITVQDCAIRDLGAGGVKVGHQSSHTRLVNNEIGDGGRIFHNAVGVWIGQSDDNLVAHNDIHHLFYTGVSVGWIWGYAPSKSARNIVEFNRIHHIGQGLLSDMAGVYTLGISPGTCVRNNLIHDIEADEYGGWGLYTDEGSSEIVMENNVVYRTTHGGFHQHYGKDNVIRNNVLAFAKNSQVARTREEEHKSFTFERNIVCFDEGTLLGGKWKNDRFDMNHNLYWRVENKPFDFAGVGLADWQQRGHDRDSIVADPRFVDPANGNFSLQPGSPAEKVGFVPIDLSRVGRTAARADAAEK